MSLGILAQEGDPLQYFVAWVSTGLRHEAVRLSRQRQRRNQREVLVLDSPIPVGADAAEDAGRMIDLIPGCQDTEKEAEDRVILAEVLSELTPAQRTVIDGLVLHGLTERAVARSLGVSQPTVNRTKWAALNKIKPHLTQGGEHV